MKQHQPMDNDTCGGNGKGRTLENLLEGRLPGGKMHVTGTIRRDAKDVHKKTKHNDDNSQS